MKKLRIILALILLCSMCGCSGGEANKGSVDVPNPGNSMSEGSDMSGYGNTVDGQEEETEVDAINRTIIAEALQIDESSRSIRFILSCLNTIGAGQIQSAESIEVEGEKAIDLIAEDSTNYRIYISGSGSVEAVKNLDTCEWPIRSER